MAIAEILVPALVFILTTLVYFVFNPEAATKLRNRLSVTVSRASENIPDIPSIPNITGEGNDGNQEDGDEVPDYSDIFPPSRRQALLEILPQLPKDHPFHQRSQSSLLEGSAGTLSKHTSIPFDKPNSKLSGNEMSPTGFTVEEIRQLGDFPDYATLAGMPLPPAYTNFDINRAIPRPYRPFRWPYHQTMSIMKLDSDWWLELEYEYKEKIAQRKKLYADHGGLVLQYLPGSEIACKELMEMAVQFVCARYPMYFSMESRDGVNVLRNSILDIETKLDGSMHPLLVLLDNIPEDFAVLIRDPKTGGYYFRAGVICSALGWSLGGKIGLRLNEVHGPVPDYKEKMQFSMDRYFAKKPTDRGIQRGSWGFEVDQPLFMPPGDEHEKYRDYQDPDMTLSRLHLRVDWQTLRRLPLSGAIIFNFKAIFTQLEEFRDEPGVPAITLKVLNEAKPHIMAYKNAWHTEHVARPNLEAWNEEQKRDGKVSKDWEVETLEESPFYPGWEEKWKRNQGF